MLVKTLDISSQNVGDERASGEGCLRLLAEFSDAPYLSPERLRFRVLTGDLSWGLRSFTCSFVCEESVGDTMGITQSAHGFHPAASPALSPPLTELLPEELWTCPDRVSFHVLWKHTLHTAL